MADGTLRTWGFQANYTLGYYTQADQLSPKQAIVPGTALGCDASQYGMYALTKG